VLVVIGATASALPVQDKNLSGVTPETYLSTDPGAWGKRGVL